ncbi:Gfo/Idh/MocA family protein [Pseudogulbenkiania ferrooxidans]|uniref:Oxidoreductase domain protein n=1 Tax=Pseudogulbenkiania ferrooxidans 2002 TaxID=279714 RepID=B9Z824_9NEIS|nr:Gfo/Idh/MocA family oxidoreductase [Pseudogulbenkiania ferrooxidans]EEG07079.1 oxidoreductase domain protein [Pseudogulbenkiania ferrooxidans 2002]
MNDDYKVEVKDAPRADDGRRLRVGVIGLGIGRLHIEGWLQHPQVEVAAICDPDLERLAKVGEQFGIAARYDSADAMLAAERLDVVSVCTPNKYHKGLTLAAFEAGCHVLCEKPMALNADEGREMLAAAQRAGKRLMINFSYRFSAQSRALKAQVDAGRFGDFYFGRSVWHRRRGMPGFGGWFGTKALAGGGPLIDLGVHRLDLALWLMGYPKPTWVMGGSYDHIARPLAAQSGKDFDVEDLACALIRFDNGATLALEASWAANIREAELMETRLLGTRAGLLQHNVGEGYTFDAHIFLEQDGAQFDMRLNPAATPAHSAMHDYAEAILNEHPHPAPGEEGLIVMEILDAIYASARSGEPVRIGSAARG